MTVSQMNPFSISFGTIPAQQISRRIPLGDILDTFQSEISGNHVYMITSIRGSGKTVLMTEAAHRLQEQPEWITIDVNYSAIELPEHRIKCGIRRI